MLKEKRCLLLVINLFSNRFAVKFVVRPKRDRVEKNESDDKDD